MRILALDIGRRRTGVAFCDDVTGIPLPLDTIRHTSVDALITQVAAIVADRKIDRVVIGLPLLPSGAEGSQVQFVRAAGARLSAMGIRVDFRDERYTTPRSMKARKNGENTAQSEDGDAASACEILRSLEGS